MQLREVVFTRGVLSSQTVGEVCALGWMWCGFVHGKRGAGRGSRWGVPQALQVSVCPHDYTSRVWSGQSVSPFSEYFTVLLVGVLAIWALVCASLLTNVSHNCISKAETWLNHIPTRPHAQSGVMFT
jgi:hypothetical protein